MGDTEAHGNSSSDSIRVILRIRPPANNSGSLVCLKVLPDSEIVLTHGKCTSKDFKFDHVLDQDASQESVFHAVGKRIVEGCVEGYNGTIFAYGQTGSGKTFTMLGPSEDFDSHGVNKMNGVIPRSLEYLFQLINQKQEMHGEKVEFLCKCSFFEIYQEHIYDLLDTGAVSPLQLRESLSRGVFVDHIIETVVASVSEAFMVLKSGWNNRHVASTSMNRESSRSHAVFTLSIETKDKTGEVTKVRRSLLNMVDLAGSERQRDTGTTGQRLKEAGNINKSLSVLGNVMMSLVDIENGKQRHVPYRDSKLTFLLKDSVGGNARTCLIANIHPNSNFYGETITTLQFAQRAKMIKNKARINEDMQGDIVALQSEIKRLKIMLLRSDPKVTPTSLPEKLLERKYQDLFFDAMLLWKQDIISIEAMKLQLDAKEALVKRGNKALQSSRMIIKFRDLTITRMKGASTLLKDELVQMLNKELEALREQVFNPSEDSLQSSKVKEMELTIQQMQAQEDYRTYFKISEDKREKLLKEFDLAMKERSSEIQDSSGNLRSAAEFSKEVTRLNNEIRKLNETNNNGKHALQKKIEELEAELAGSRKAREDLEKMLMAVQEGSRIKIKRLNSVHDSAIRTITTPLKNQDQNRKRSSSSDRPPSARKMLKSNDGDAVFNLFNGSFSKKETNFLDETLDDRDEFGSTALKVELEWEREDKIKVEKQVQELERECGRLREQLTVIEKKFSYSEETVTTLKSDLTIRDENLKTKVSELSKEFDQLSQDNKLKEEEIFDLRIMLNSADKQLREYKQNLSETKGLSKEEFTKLVTTNSQLMIEMEGKITEAESLQHNVEKLNEQLTTTTEELDYANERLREASALVRLKQELCDKSDLQIKTLKEQMQQLNALHEGNNQEKEETFKQLQEENFSLHSKLASAVEQNAECQKSITEFKSDLELLEKAARYDKDNITSLLKEVSKLKGNLEQETTTCVGLQDELTSCRNQLNDFTNEMNQNCEKNELLETKLKQVSAELESSTLKHQFELENLQDDLGSLTDINTALEEDLRKKDEVLTSNVMLHEEEQRKIRREVEELQEQVRDLKKKLEVAIQDQENRGLDEALRLRLEGELDERNKQFNEMSENQDEIMKLYNSTRERCSAFEDQIRFEKERLQATEHRGLLLETELSTVRNVNSAFNEDISRLHQENQTLNEEVGTLKDSEVSLTEKLERLTAENAKLHTEAAVLAGHSNHQQKIHYLTRLKDDLLTVTNEKNNLQEQCAKLNEELRKYKHNSLLQVRRSHSPSQKLCTP
uniref:Kinesin-like protein 2 n=1 Tax=Ciona intestinalis TaxID=7719 RepID=F6WXC5_CIOIN|nr:kinesin-like protein 2 [Ciona intestinalis]|eukprot:NP_001011659.1 kinesin-like protein 2 [Ciona intestinalis]